METLPDIITRGQAKARGLTHYFTGKPCRRGHVDTRRTGDGRCLACGRENASAWAADNQDHILAYRASYVAENMDKIRAYQNDYRRRNPEAVKRWSDDNYYRNIDKSRATRRNAYSKNKISYFVQAAKRRAAKRSATPPWLNSDHQRLIAGLYAEAKRLEAETGVKHHVDHIVPLTNSAVCGLHVPWNLQVISANDNLKKSNKFEAA